MIANMTPKKHLMIRHKAKIQLKNIETEQIVPITCENDAYTFVWNRVFMVDKTMPKTRTFVLCTNVALSVFFIIDTTIFNLLVRETLYQFLNYHLYSKIILIIIKHINQPV